MTRKGGKVIRTARTEGPRRITVQGPDEVVIVSRDESRRHQGEPTGAALVRMLQDSPLRDVTLDHKPTHAPPSPVEL